MMIPRTSLAVGVALLALLACPAACAAETNGQRMARGLPPLPPKFARNLPGRRDSRQPTPAWGEKPRPSTRPPTPPTPYSGCLEVRDEQGHALGRVKNTNTSSTINGLSLSRGDDDLKVSFSVPYYDNNPFDILATNPQFPQPYYVGAAGTIDINTLDLTSKNTIAFTNVQQTPSSSIPVVSTFDATLMVQSAIWSFHSENSRLTAQYINPDGSLPATTLAYDEHANTLFFVGNIDVYNADNANPASIVNLFLVDDDGRSNHNGGHDDHGSGHGNNDSGHNDSNGHDNNGSNHDNGHSHDH